MSARKVVEEVQAGAPMWLLSFGDMMTNLLCFFVLLVAFAKDQRAGFISDGITSIRQAFGALGRPGFLHGDALPMDLGADRVMFRPAKSIFAQSLVEPDGRILDANRDSMRSVVTSALEKDGTSEIPIPLVFLPGSSTLSDAHRTALREIAPRLRGGDFKIHVEGYAWREGADFKSQWSIALQRAQNVAKFISGAGAISADRLVPIGYGPGDGDTKGRLSESQERWGRRIVIISVSNS